MGSRWVGTGGVGVVSFDRAGSVLGRCMSRVEGVRIRGSHLHFHHGVRQVNRVVTCRVDGAFTCSMGRVRAPLKVSPIDAPSDRLIVDAVLHTKLPFRRNFLDCFSGTRGTFISTCHGCGSALGFSVRVRCVTSPHVSKGALVVASPVLTAKDDVRLDCRTVLAGKRPTRVRITSVVTDERTIRRVTSVFPRSGAAV